MSADTLDRAVELVKAGGLLGYPTETVWGLGADASSESALERLRRFKRRPESSPISILVDDASRLPDLGFEMGSAARRLAELFWPGPLTLVLPCKRRFARGVARADGAVGLRCSSHPVTAELARRLARAGVGPITATSLNRCGDEAARTRAEAYAVCHEEMDGPQLFEDKIEAGGEAESTVLDLSSAEPLVLRWGAITREMLEPVLGGIETA